MKDGIIIHAIILWVYLKTRKGDYCLMGSLLLRLLEKFWLTKILQMLI